MKHDECVCVEVDDGVMKNEDAWHFRFSVSTDELSAWGWKGIRVSHGFYFQRLLFVDVWPRLLIARLHWRLRGYSHFKEPEEE